MKTTRGSYIARLITMLCAKDQDIVLVICQHIHKNSNRCILLESMHLQEVLRFGH